MTFEGLGAAQLAARLSLPQCLVHERVASTMDAAHAAAADGAAAGTLVLANAQDAGRGRGGKRWTSPPGGGLWMTLIERPASPQGLEVLSLRIGLRVAAALDALAEHPISLKWPNDLQVQGAKLGGILVEARWRDLRIEWVAIGIGVNVRSPLGVEAATGLRAGTSRLEAMGCIVPALRAAAHLEGPLTAAELAQFASRDAATGRRIQQPAVGVVRGIGATGELMVETEAGIMACRSGSLVFAENR
ncbi:MAG: biotin--[acetyl-CoA-carboxylase] ligase [Gemmatimonadota bacterium]|nr:biotin--[acetyl-CoA-carboxylase] ligase [Gemmatimonadota bacterium]